MGKTLRADYIYQIKQLSPEKAWLELKHKTIYTFENMVHVNVKILFCCKLSRKE